MKLTMDDSEINSFKVNFISCNEVLFSLATFLVLKYADGMDV